MFANLVETDQVFGHRKDIPGFHGALKGIDAAVGEWLPRLDPDRDLLVITADHGVDPTTPGTDHTREHVPLLARFHDHGGRHDGPFADVGASVLRWLAGRDAPGLPGHRVHLVSDSGAMPELPEVETIRRHLAPHVEGRTLDALEVSDERWSRPLAPAELAAAVDGRRIEALARRGKYLIWELEDDVHLMVHLRMTGTLLLDPPETPRFARVRFALGDGHELWFDDPRRFGTGELALGGEARDAFFASRLGVEPLGPDFTSAHLYALTRASRAPIKAFLLDQRKVAGVGNIYADEALFRARIHPLRPAARLTRSQVAALRDAIVVSLEAGLDAKGASIDDYRQPDGVQGSFQHRFLIHLREGEPCLVCGRPVRKLRAAGRGTYVCERCQPRPRRRQAAARNSARRPARSAAASS